MVLALRLPATGSTLMNTAVRSRFESADFETVGGLVLGALGRAPEVGDKVSMDGHLLRVDEIDGPRVAKVIVTETDGGS